MKRTLRTPRPISLAVGVFAFVATAAIARAQCTGCANPSFDAPPSYGGDYVGAGFAVADFDRDGRLDVVVPNYSGYDAARIYYGDGRGGFAPTPTVLGPATYWYPYLTVASDLNVDGFPDVLLTRDGILHVLMADGQGGYSIAGPVQGMGGVGNLVAAADFDGDGVPDLVTAVASSDAVLLFHGNRDGTFGPPTSFPVGNDPFQFVVADFNGDSKPDVAVANATDLTISVLLGDGAGHLTVTSAFSYGGDYVFAIAAGDLDGDGHADLALGGRGNTTEGFLVLAVGDGTGHFVPRPVTDLDAELSAIVVADLSGDGKADVLTESNGFDGLTISLNLGGGTFAPPVSYDFPGLFPGVGDFDRDGHLDVALAGRGVLVLRNDGAGGLIVAPRSPVVTYPVDAVLADLNGDSFPDLVVASEYFGASVSSYLGNGDGTFGPAHQVDVLAFPNSLNVADFTGDGKEDVALTDATGVLLIPGDGMGGLGTPIPVDAGPNVGALAYGDFDEDGKPDLLVTGPPTTVLFNDGQGGFLPPETVAALGGLVRVADVDGDGHLDFVLSTGTEFATYLGDGDGGFTGPTFSLAGPATSRFVIADIDEDGKPDIVGNDVYGLFRMSGDGSGGFGEAVYVFPEGSSWLDVADFNADGHLDLAMNGNSSVRVALGDGHGGFAPPTQWATPLGSAVVFAVGDLDADSKPDLLAAERETFALLNTNCRARRVGVATDLSCALPGQAFSQQPSVAVYDDGGNVVHCDAGLVSASIVPGTGAPGAALGGDKTVPAVSGVAAFTDLSIDLAGSGYEIQFSHPVAGVTRSRAFRVGDPPPSPVATNSGPFCQGQDLALYATTVPGAVYRWTGPNGFFSTVQSPVIPAATLGAAGDYSVVALVNGCESSAATTTVQALTPAPGPAILGASQVCSGSRLLLHVDDGALIHTWYHNGVPIEGVTGPVYSVAQAYYGEAGAYTVTSRDASGCTTALSSEFDVAIVFCHAEAKALAVDPGGNGILEPGESAIIDPTWKNRDIDPLHLVGTLGAFAGPLASYAIDDGSADYGTIDPDASADCFAATGDCYSVTVSGTRPATHWDAFLDEKPGLDPTHTWLLHVGGSFGDVPTANSFYSAIETVLHNGITAGCSPGLYCPGNGVTRAQMAVFLLKANYGAAYDPGPASGSVFADVPADAFAAAWIERLASMGVTSGCGNNNYCPNQVVTRAQMAVFLLKIHFNGPLPCTGIFADVPCPGGFAVDYIETIYNQGVTGGCGQSPLVYCPNNPTTRGQMAVFLTRDFSLLLYGP